MKTSAQIRAEITGIDPDLRLTRNRVIAARNRRAFLEELALSELTFARGGEDLSNPSNSAPALGAFVQSDSARELATVHSVLSVLEASPQYAEASRLLDPLHAELDQALAREAEEAAAVAQAQAAVDAAEAAARARIEGKIATDPGVTKARAALAGIRRLGQPLEAEEDIGRELAMDMH